MSKGGINNPLSTIILDSFYEENLKTWEEARPFLKARIFDTKKEALSYTNNPALIEKVDVITVKYYSDSGHGWYAIKRDILQELGILDQISAYSYQRGATVYLEEDSDASEMFKALEEKNMLVDVRVGKNYDGRAPIRSYDQFQK